MTSNVYEIKTLHDFRKIPTERRAECLREFEYALDLIDLAFDEHQAEDMLKTFTWTDDGKSDIDMSDTDGNAILSLRVKE